MPKLARKPKNPMRYDPSRTGLLRRQLTAAMRKSFMELKLELVKVIVQEDAFGLRSTPTFNVFCATGPGGGVDPTCGKGGVGSRFSTMPIGKATSKEAKKWRKDNQKNYDNDPEFRAVADAVALYTQGDYSVQRAFAQHAVTGSLPDEYKDSAIPGWVDKGMHSNPLGNFKTYFDGQEWMTSGGESKATYREASRALVNAVADSSPLSTSIYRGIGGRDAAKSAKNLKPGDDFSIIAPVSFTTDADIGREFSQGTAKGQRRGRRGNDAGVVFEVLPGARGLPVSAISPWDQKEVLSSGSFKVKEVRENAGFVHVVLEQTDTYRPAIVANAASIVPMEEVGLVKLLAMEPRPFPQMVLNVFCATGPGGGVDPTCGKGDAGPIAKPEFRKWFGKSKVVRHGKPAETAEAEAGGTMEEPIVVFHGTSKGAFSEFRKDKIANPNDLFFGPGFYFTEDVKAAEVFAHTQHAVGARDNPTVMKLYLKVEKPFDVDKDRIHTDELPEHERKQIRAQLVQKVFGEEGRSEALQAGRDFDSSGLKLDYKTLVNNYGVSKVAINDMLQRKGHDGLTVKSAETEGTLPGTNRFWIVFEPTQIKATTATKFDPNDPNILNVFCATGIGGGVRATCKKAGAVLAAAGKAGKWLKAKTKAIFKRLEGRYGTKAATAIFASGQAISWGSFAVGAAMGHVVWVPSAVATIPGAAIAEVRRMAKARKRAPTANEAMTLTKEEIKRLGQELVDEITKLWSQVDNVFCATGKGGGVDATCKRGTGSGTKGDPVKCGADLDCASTALAQGKYIELHQPAQVSTLIRKMHREVQRAVALGEKAPAFDLCKVSVPGTNLFCHETIGVPRAKMPQMRGLPIPGTYAATLKPNKKGKVDVGQEFIAHLESQGIKVKQKEIRASHLRASQNEIDGARVAELVAGGDDLRKRPIYVTRDNYVLDGHHHWAALVGQGYERGKNLKVPVYKLDMDIGQGIAMANEFAKQAGIAPKTVASAIANVRWKFELEGDQVRLFKEWLKKQANATVSGKKQEDLIKRFLAEAYRKGLGRAFDDTAKVASSNREEFLRTSFGATVAPATVQLIAAQSFSDLEGVTDAMSARMVKQLVKGFTAGQSPRVIARALAREVDIGLARAETIARTEVIRAHAQGQLNALKALGVDKIGVMVEWSTAHDGKVCPLCASMGGKTFTVDQAQGLIPAHPNCRCAFIPAGKPLLVNRFEHLWNVFCATGKGGGIKATCKKGGVPGSQMPESQKKQVRALGMVGTFPPAHVPMSDIRVHHGTAEELRFKPIMQWTQVTKSGRTSAQYRYTQDFHDRNAAEKFDRVLKVEPHLGKVKMKLAERMGNRKLSTKERDGAAIASIIAETGLRPTDGDASVKHGHYGIASLRARHVTVKGDVVKLSFIGKEGVRNRTVVRDPANVAYLKSKLDGRDQLWEAGSVTAGRILREVTAEVGGPSDVKLKDLRIVKATQVARSVVSKYRMPKLTGNVKKDTKTVMMAIKEVSTKVAKVLNNTPAQAKSSYIHPEIFKAWFKRS